MPELLDILFDAESRFYERKLIDLANNRNTCATSRYRAQDVSLRKHQISKVEDGLYHVESESNPDRFYRVCTASGTCECPQGRNRGPCKHKDAIHHHFGEAEFNVVPTQDPSSRRLWNYIATGQCLPESWFRNFRDSQAPLPSQSNEETHATDLDANVENDDEDMMNDDQDTAERGNDIVSEDDSAVLGDNVQIEAPESDPDHEANDWEQDVEDFRSTVEKVIDAVKEGYEKKDTNIIKGFKFFSKSLKRSVTNKQVLVQNMFSYGSETDDVVKGKRKKRGIHINVQPTALTRRRYKEKGKGQSTKGRRLREVEEHAAGAQLNVTDESENEGTSYSVLPTKKQKKNISQKKHSLKTATDKNISAARKH